MSGKKYLSVVLALMIAGVVVVAGCAKQESAPAEKPAAKAPAEAKTVEIAQKTCPVIGGLIDKDMFVDVKGRRIYLCCAHCKAKVQADPDKYIAKVDADIKALKK